MYPWHVGVNMAESHDPLAEYKAELDDICARVMPDSWAGHGRLLIHERDFDPDDRRFARRLFERASENHPDMDAERLAEKVVEKVESRGD
jgi:hypothetical protein